MMLDNALRLWLQHVLLSLAGAVSLQSAELSKSRSKLATWLPNNFTAKPFERKEASWGRTRDWAQASGALRDGPLAGACLCGMGHGHGAIDSSPPVQASQLGFAGSALQSLFGDLQKLPVMPRGLKGLAEPAGCCPWHVLNASHRSCGRSLPRPSTLAWTGLEWSFQLEFVALQTHWHLLAGCSLPQLAHTA